MRVFRELLITLLIAVVIFIGLQISIKSFEVFNVSMLPTYREGDLIVVNKLAYQMGNNPHVRDEIVFYAPGNGPRPAFDPFFTQHPNCFIKRVIGTPGDTVEVRDKAVFVNGNRLNEPYVYDVPQYYMAETALPDGMFFVLGDNRNHSNDSHTGWFVPRSDIIGKVWFRYWSTSENGDVKVAMIPIFLIVVAALVIAVVLDIVRSRRSAGGT